MSRTRSLLVLTMAALVAACSSAGEGEDPDRLRVVATTTILGDVVDNVTRGRADVEVLMPIGASAHEFVPSAQQAAMLYEADLVVANGLGLEEGLADVLDAARADGVNVLEVAPHLEPLNFADGDGLDPHVWMDPLRMQVAAQAIAKALFLLDGDEAWYDGAEAYAADLEMAHRRIESVLAAVPAEDRKLVTNHDVLGYLAVRYGFEVIGTVIPGGSSLGDPSSAELAELVAVIEREQVPAIFGETSESLALAEAVAAEAGADVAVVELYTESLGEAGATADSLIGMLLLDAERIAEALG